MISTGDAPGNGAAHDAHRGNSDSGNRQDRWTAVLIDCAPEYADIVSQLAFEAGCSGLEERMERGRVILAAFFYDLPETGDAPPDRLDHALDELCDRTGFRVCRIVAVSRVPAEDWETAWRTGLGPVETGRRLVTRPSWVDYDNRDGRIEIVIDPKMAFGTGGHATTALCLEALERLDPTDKRVLDVGCGSGVLSIAAGKLGAATVYGFDLDRDSVENARDNVAMNGVSGNVFIEYGDLADISPGAADIVLANVLSGTLIAHLPRFHALLAPRGTVIFSGILAEEEPVFVTALEAQGFRLIRVDHRDEWIALEAAIQQPEL